MENHPIPQDVTNFQFKLIGEMTIKQFGYLVGGVILAWICLSLPIFFWVKGILAGFFVCLGILLAFMPIEGRPADLMLLNFIKSLFAPNQYLFQAQNDSQTITVTKSPTATQKQTRQDDPTPKADPAQPTSPVPAKQTTAIDTAPIIEKPEIKNSVTQAAFPAVPAKTIKQETTSINPELEILRSELQKTSREKTQLETELKELKTQIASQKLSTKQFTPPVYPRGVGQTIQNIPYPPLANRNNTNNFSLPEHPNMVKGVIKDSRGNILQGILVEIKDQDNNPIRAFKTNALGQFISATPLPNNRYSVIFEDPQGKHSFTNAEITVSGGILEPLEIVSVDDREKLRQELFG